MPLPHVSFPEPLTYSTTFSLSVSRMVLMVSATRMAG